MQLADLFRLRAFGRLAKAEPATRLAAGRQFMIDATPHIG
jgi:hypothetical protein